MKKEIIFVIDEKPLAASSSKQRLGFRLLLSGLFCF
jgi:hypothetical protein